MKPWRRANTDWFVQSRWGVFGCYLADTASNLKAINLTAEDWNRRIDAFDATGLARQLADASVPYFSIAIGQNSGFYLSPNRAYDEIVGISPSKCSRRDLVADLARAFEPYGTRLMVYLPSGAPAADAVAKERLESPPDERMTALQRHWEAVVREWSLRWGRSVHGWWIDGPYNAPAYQHPDAPNYRSFAEALKAGNPDSLVSFNNGLRTPLYSMTEFEDYTPGEIERDMTVAAGNTPDYSRLAPYSRLLDGAQLHVLTIMGEWWGKGPVRFPDELTIGYTKFINGQGGAVTWDVPLTPSGLIEESFRPQLAALGVSLPVCRGLERMMDDYYTRLAREQLGARAASVAALRTPEDVAARQRYIRATILKAIGGLPEARTPLQARITGTLEREGYRVEKLIYQSRPRSYVTANVYVPTGIPGPFPAVLGAMGHYEEGKAFEEGQRLFISLARRGFVVLAYDPPDEGERNEYLDVATGKLLVPNCPEAHTMSGLQCLLTGRNLAHYELWDGIRAVDYLEGRPDVDAKRIAVIGNSGGGTQCSYLAVIEPRLAAAVPCCYITSWEKLWAKLGPQDAEQNFPDFLKDGLDFPDFPISFAPKPFKILSATRDFFPIEGSRDTYAEARRIYSILGKEECAGYFEYDDTHSWSKPRREATYAWLEKWLMGRAESAPEPELEIEPIGDLNCTATGQVLTSFNATTVQRLNAEAAGGIHPHRRAATPEGASQLADLIVQRLKITLPHGAPKVEAKGTAAREGCRIEKIAIETEPGIVVPTLVFVPVAQASPPASSTIAGGDACATLGGGGDRGMRRWQIGGFNAGRGV